METSKPLVVHGIMGEPVNKDFFNAGNNQFWVRPHVLHKANSDRLCAKDLVKGCATHATDVIMPKAISISNCSQHYLLEASLLFPHYKFDCDFETS
jgi:hypothetical protein